MAEEPSAPPYAVHAGTTQKVEFGPSLVDQQMYTDLLRRVDGGELLPDRFDPSDNALLTGGQIDQGAASTFINPETQADGTGLSDGYALKFYQQRYIAGVLGLQVGETAIWPRLRTITATVQLPSADMLPALPNRNIASGATDRNYYTTSDGQELSRVRGDAIFAGHYIARHRDHYSQLGAFDQLFKSVEAAAGSGEIRVPANTYDVDGCMSLMRQVANVLGYEVGDYRSSPDGNVYVMQTGPMRSGFDQSIDGRKKLQQ